MLGPSELPLGSTQNCLCNKRPKSVPVDKVEVQWFLESNSALDSATTSIDDKHDGARSERTISSVSDKAVFLCKGIRHVVQQAEVGSVISLQLHHSKDPAATLVADAGMSFSPCLFLGVYH
jgi:hypothetical protein